MKALSSVLLLVLVAAAPTLRADSAYFLKPAARPASTVTSPATKSVPASTDRVSVSVLPIRRTTTPSVTSAKMPMVRADRLFTRGAGQAAVVR